MTDSESAFGKYQLKRKLGSGGFGEVWQASDTELKRDVALKVLHQGLMTDARFVDKAQREARLVGQLDHPNIVKVLEVNQTAGRMYIAMEYIDGHPLSELIKVGRRFTMEQALSVVEQMASALDATHEKKIVHRDVKPENILIDSSGYAHLVDFGLAHAALSSLGASATAVGLGTAMYMSPEQAAGRTGDRATDIYSLGVIAYELLVGRLPFQADTLMGYMIAHKDQAPPLPSNVNPSLSRDVQDVLLKALSKDPARRYKTAGAFARALRKAAARPFRRVGRSLLAPLGCAVAALAVIALVVGAGGAAAYFGLIPVPGPLQPLFGLASASQTPPVIVSVSAALSETPVPTLTNAPPSRAPAAASSTSAPAAIVIPAATNTTAPKATVSPSETPAPTAAPADSPTAALPTPSLVPPSDTPAAGVGPTQVSSADGMVLLYVPAGNFVMGSSADDPNGQANEKPQHTVSLDAFWIDRTEVTSGMYAPCVAAHACRTSGSGFDNNPNYADYPEIYVPWDDANTYCNWAGRRLPTEAEWEKAVRGTDGRLYPWGNDYPNGTLLNYNKTVGFVAAVGRYPKGASPYGALDMAGSVWEWVADWYDAGYYAQSPSSNPTGPASGQQRVLRGGSWVNDAVNVRAADRLGAVPGEQENNFGFRCARS